MFRKEFSQACYPCPQELGSKVGFGVKPASVDADEVSEAVEWKKEGREAGQGDSLSGIS